MNIGKRISIVRQARGLTIKEVAKQIGKTTYDRVETGKIEPKFSEVLQVCKILNIPIWELVAKDLIIKYNEDINV